MYIFVNQELKKDFDKLISKGWYPSKGKVSGNSIEFEAQLKFGLQNL